MQVNIDIFQNYINQNWVKDTKKTEWFKTGMNDSFQETDYKEKRAMYDPDEECSKMIASIKRLCDERGMKPHTLAKEAGISSSTMSYLLNGKTMPYIYTIFMLCNVLDVTISELFGEKNEGNTALSQISDEEEKLVQQYRQLSKQKQELLRVYLDMLLKYEDGPVFTIDKQR